MMQELVLLLLFICDSVILPNVLWQGLKPWNSLSGARDYARSAVASWTLHIFDDLFATDWNSSFLGAVIASCGRFIVSAE